jgi:hypothetical protein
MRHDEKRYLSAHKHVQLITGNTLVTFPVLYEEEYDYAGSDEMHHAHQIVLAMNVKPARIEGEMTEEAKAEAWDDIAFPKWVPMTEAIEHHLFAFTLDERVNYQGPKIFANYDSTLPVD